MNYEEFVNNKTQLQPVYIINGGESLLTTLALKEIENRLNIMYPDFNKTIISDDSGKTAVDIVNMCSIAPFCDEKRLIVVNDYLNKKNEGEKKIFTKYFASPVQSCCLVFFSTEKSEFFISLEGSVPSIDCEKVSQNFLVQYIKNYATKNNFIINNQAIEKLIDYCNLSVTKIDSELNKLKNINKINNEVTAQDVEQNVTKDIEYIIFDLTNAISQKNNDKVYLLIDAMLKNKEQPINIIATISSHFRRLFFVSRSDFTNRELSEMLSVKEYAITKYKAQAQNFGQRKLKEIYDTCISVEFMAKNGEMEGKNAINFLIANILK